MSSQVVMVLAQPYEIVVRGFAIVFDRALPMILLKSQSLAAAGHDAVLVAVHDGRGQRSRDIAAGTNDGSHIHSVSNDHIEEGVSEEIPSMLDRNRANSGDLAGLSLHNRAASK